MTDDLVVSVEGAGADANAHHHQAQIRASRASRAPAFAEPGAQESKTLDPRSLLAAGFVVLATSLDAETYPADELLAMYRLRWQINSLSRD